MNKIYEEGTHAAYKNSLSLLEEANIMFNNSKFARAYALGVLSAEEFAKSFIYKCISVGLIKHDFRRDIIKHQEKIFHIIHILLMPRLLHVRYKKFLDACDHDKHEKDHSKHLGFEAFKRIYKFWEYTEDQDETLRQLRIFEHADNLKLKALYVDIVGNNVILPDDVIGMEKGKEIIDFLNTHAHGFEIILNESDEHFKEVVKLLDPQIYSGTIKSNFTKFRGRDGNSSESEYQ